MKKYTCHFCFSDLKEVEDEELRTMFNYFCDVPSCGRDYHAFYDTSEYLVGEVFSTKKYIINKYGNKSSKSFYSVFRKTAEKASDLPAPLGFCNRKAVGKFSESEIDYSSSEEDIENIMLLK